MESRPTSGRAPRQRQRSRCWVSHPPAPLPFIVRRLVHTHIGKAYVMDSVIFFSGTSGLRDTTCVGCFMFSHIRPIVCDTYIGCLCVLALEACRVMLRGRPTYHFSRRGAESNGGWQLGGAIVAYLIPIKFFYGSGASVQFFCVCLCYIGRLVCRCNPSILGSWEIIFLAKIKITLEVPGFVTANDLIILTHSID